LTSVECNGNMPNSVFNMEAYPSNHNGATGARNLLTVPLRCRLPRPAHVARRLPLLLNMDGATRTVFHRSRIFSVTWRKERGVLPQFSERASASTSGTMAIAAVCGCAILQVFRPGAPIMPAPCKAQGMTAVCIRSLADNLQVLRHAWPILPVHVAPKGPFGPSQRLASLER